MTLLACVVSHTKDGLKLSQQPSQLIELSRHHGVERFVNMSQMTVTQMSITQIPAYWIGRIGAGPAAVREIGSAGVRSGSTARIRSC